MCGAFAMTLSASVTASAKDLVSTRLPSSYVVHICTGAVQITSQDSRTCSRLRSMTSARRSPPTQRVVSLLDHFVARRGGRYGLSELSRELGMSKPTCLGIVTTLVESGHLTVDPVSKTYGLGPS